MKLIIKLEKFLSFRTHLLVGLAFSLPLARRIASPIFVGWVIVTCLHFWLNKGWRINVEFRRYPLILLFLPLVYYGLNVIGLIHTTDLHQGLFELEKKISLLVLPVLFLFDREALTAFWIRRVFWGFCAGLALMSTISIGLGFYHSLSWVNGHLVFRTAVNDISYERGYTFFQQVTQGGNYFFDQYISPFMHTTYYGMYLSFGIIISIWLSRFQKKKILNYIIAGVFLVVMVFSDSRGAILSFVLTLLVLGLLFIKGKYTRYGLPALMVVLLSVILLSPRTVLLFEDLGKTIKGINYESQESAALRIIVWKSSLEVIGENYLVGVGTGDAEIALLSKTQRINKMAFENKLNAHNEYLQTFITLGVAGFVVLSTLLLMSFFYAVRTDEAEFAAFLMIVGFNMLFESLLETFQGIMFVSLFFSAMILYLFGKQNESTLTGRP